MWAGQRLHGANLGDALPNEREQMICCFGLASCSSSAHGIPCSPAPCARPPRHIERCSALGSEATSSGYRLDALSFQLADKPPAMPHISSTGAIAISWHTAPFVLQINFTFTGGWPLLAA